MNKDEMINYGIQIIEQSLCKPDTIKFDDIGLREMTYIIKELNKRVMEDLYNEGYRKVADDEIVVKKEAYEKFVGQLIEQEEIAHSYEQGYAELLQSNHFLQDKLENARQETTREILQKLKDNIMLADFGCGDGYEEVVDMNTDELKKLAKQYGIELEDLYGKDE